jgi:hypothetical protein
MMADERTETHITIVTNSQNIAVPLQNSLHRIHFSARFYQPLLFNSARTKSSEIGTPLRMLAEKAQRGRT